MGEKLVEIDLKLLSASKQEPTVAYFTVKDRTYPDINSLNTVPTPSEPLDIRKEQYTIEYHDTKRTQKMILPWKMHLASPMMRGK